MTVNDLAALQAQLTKLQAQVTALSNASQGEALQPSYLTVNADGTVSADFTGVVNALGLTIPAATDGIPPVSTNSVDWIRSSDGAAVASITGEAPSVVGTNPTQLILAALSPDTASASSTITLAGDRTAGGGGRDFVQATAAGNVVSIIDDANRSTFLQAGANVLSRLFGGTLTWPGGTPYSNNNTFTLSGASGTCNAIVSAQGNINDSGGAFVGQGLITVLSQQGGVIVTAQALGVSPSAGCTMPYDGLCWGT